jgi:hypothetical protein
MFAAWNNSAIIDTILMVAGYTYGPLLGLFSLGLFTKISIKDRWVPLVCFLAPAITYFINNWLASNTKFKIGPELIIYNGLISFILLYFFLRKKENFD